MKRAREVGKAPAQQTQADGGRGFRGGGWERRQIDERDTAEKAKPRESPRFNISRRCRCRTTDPTVYAKYLNTRTSTHAVNPIAGIKNKNKGGGGRRDPKQSDAGP